MSLNKFIYTYKPGNDTLGTRSTLSVGGKTLKLNGAGIRKKVFIKVYVGALYLEENATDPSAIIKADSARAVHMVFLRSVDKAKILGAYKEGFENNSGDKMAALQAGLDKLAGVISDAKEGTAITISYVPGKGTTLAVQGGGSVTIEGKDFADAMFLIWLGSCEQISRLLVWLVLAINALWVIDSLVLLVSGWIAPNLLGHVFVIGQALLVLLFPQGIAGSIKHAVEHWREGRKPRVPTDAATPVSASKEAA